MEKCLSIHDFLNQTSTTVANFFFFLVQTKPESMYPCGQVVRVIEIKR